ncbi:hypothetical protein PRZ48_008860 [Zasmidium cellare]|uniref:Uncharacterized protein n=1 Tax=Zasmidium cellare TaxID=395010 RepID=A0ABR0EGN9_ZASCE|nr:hypothetical protein PRZ48_008860 [Zasmidium cellare]
MAPTIFERVVSQMVEMEMKEQEMDAALEDMVKDSEDFPVLEAQIARDKAYIQKRKQKLEDYVTGVLLLEDGSAEQEELLAPAMLEFTAVPIPAGMNLQDFVDFEIAQTSAGAIDTTRREDDDSDSEDDSPLAIRRLKRTSPSSSKKAPSKNALLSISTKDKELGCEKDLGTEKNAVEMTPAQSERGCATSGKSAEKAEPTVSSNSKDEYQVDKECDLSQLILKYASKTNNTTSKQQAIAAANPPTQPVAANLPRSMPEEPTWGFPYDLSPAKDATATGSMQARLPSALRTRAIDLAGFGEDDMPPRKKRKSHLKETNLHLTILDTGQDVDTVVTHIKKIIEESNEKGSENGTG